MQRAAVFHIDKGDYNGVALDGLNVAVIAHTPGAMANGNWTLAAYFDERADEKQTAALAAISGGGEGGPMAAFAPMVGKHLGVKKVPIKYSINGKTRSVEIPDIMRLAVEPLPSAHPSGERLGLRLVHAVCARQARIRRGRPGQLVCRCTACAGTIRARTTTTRRSTGRTNRHFGFASAHAGRGTCPTRRLIACCCATVGLSAAALQRSPSSPGFGFGGNGQR